MKTGVEQTFGTNYSESYDYVSGLSGDTARIVSRRHELQAGSVISGNKRDPNPFWFQKCVLVGGGATQDARGFLYGRSYYTKSYSPQLASISYSGLTPQFGTDYSKAYDRCLDKLFDQVKGLKGPNLIVDAVESGQTIHMIRKALSLKKLIKEFQKDVLKSRKYKSSRGSERINYVSNKWLEYRYGWMPLLSSIYDTVKQLGRKVDAATMVIKVRSGTTLNWVDISGNGTYYVPTVKSDISSSVRVQLRVVYERQAGTHLYNYTSLNPLGIAWELVPYSFVVDWLVDVGGLLDRWENYVLFGNSFSNISVTKSYKEVVTETRSGQSFSPIIVYSGGVYPDQTNYLAQSNATTAIRTGMTRELLTELPRPSAAPRFNFRMGAKQFADAVSLVRQQLVSRRLL